MIGQPPRSALFPSPSLFRSYPVGAWLLLRRLRIDPRLPGQRDVAWFLGLAAVAGPLVVAVAQVLQYTVTGLLNWGAFFRGVLGFWSGRATGVGVLAAALLIASRRTEERRVGEGWRC